MQELVLKRQNVLLERTQEQQYHRKATTFHGNGLSEKRAGSQVAYFQSNRVRKDARLVLQAFTLRVVLRVVTVGTKSLLRLHPLY